ncbi:hypothetical protein PISL3812_05910 [Talaromyces islandicus]|uniref:Lysine-specific metallo-endopeptidase domain-containing protein n=1 Tax=Talaromyces islandicus TaxID=28573 RepID=A0A0U1LZZ6_TALIS|nr:hypothetical protein PISL3812_05910 [Talaromyces islandicus]
MTHTDIVIKIASINDDEPHGRDWFMDTRPLDDGGGGLIHFQATCADDVMSYSWSAAPGRHYQTVYCADWVENWNMYGPLSAYCDSRGLSIRVLRGTLHITQIALSFMAPAVLHELTHSQYILGNDALVDQSCTALGGTAFGYSDGYGWPCITWLAQTHPQQAAKNADSFAYLVTALYLDYADWRDGLCLRD